jgi:hypothetical protein
MAWNGIIMRFGDVKHVEDLPMDIQLLPIGKLEFVLNTLQRVLPDANNHRVGQVSLEGDDFWLELDYDCHTDSEGMVSAMSIRSNAGNGSLEPLQLICDAFDSRLFDCQTGELADLAAATGKSMKTFSDWRDRVIFDAPLDLQDIVG